MNTAHYSLGRKAIEAGGFMVAPEASAADIEAHGRNVAAAIGAGRNAPVAPAELTSEGRQRAAQTRRPTPAPRSTRTARPGPSLPQARRVAGAVAAPLQQASAGLAEGVTGGAIAGDSAIGRLLGATLVGLFALVLGGMFSKKDFALNVGAPGTGVTTVPVTNPAALAAVGAGARSFGTAGPAAAVVAASNAPGPTRGALP